MDDDYILTHCSESGESIARAMGKDGANVRKRIRKLRVAYPNLDWYEDVRQVSLEGDFHCVVKKPRPVTPRPGVKADVSTTVVCGDLHVPFHDVRAIGCVLGYIRDVKPDTLVLNGDVVDFYAVSSFSKDPVRETMLQDELDQAAHVLDAFDAAMPKGARKVFVVGNHEARLERYIKEHARAFHGLRSLTLDSLLNLTERGYEVVPMVGRDASTHIGKVNVGHFNVARKGSGASARSLLLDRGCSVIQAHTHRLGAIYKRNRGTGEQLGAWEAGCLCDLDPEYVTSPDWQSGFATITTCTSGRYHVALHEILGGELLAAGRRY